MADIKVFKERYKKESQLCMRKTAQVFEVLCKFLGNWSVSTE